MKCINMPKDLLMKGSKAAGRINNEEIFDMIVSCIWEGKFVVGREKKEP